MQIAVILCSLLCGLLSLYMVWSCVGGLVLKRRRVEPQPPGARIAAVIAARNEEAVIGHLVRSLLRQDYPRELYDIYVVPNNCTDATEDEARAAGAQILACELPVHSKGDVLRQAFAQLTAMNRYDAYCVFDADNLVDKGFMRAVNDALASGQHVAQGFRDSKNPFDSWMSGSMSVFYWFMSRFYNESRSRLGLSCALNGTGFMVSDAVIRDIGWNVHTLTEDLEFTGLCAIHGYKIGWMPNAKVYDEQATRFWDSCIQRRRWTAGSLQCMRGYVGRLLKKHTRSSIDVALLFLGNLMCVMGLIPTVASVNEIYKRIAEAPQQAWRVILPLLLGLAFYWIACSIGAAIMFKWHHRLNRRCVPAILCFPIFLASWMPVNLYACFTPPPQWKVIRHVHSVATPDGESEG